MEKLVIVSQWRNHSQLPSTWVFARTRKLACHYSSIFCHFRANLVHDRFAHVPAP